jgi:hypothetical protein
MTTAQEASPKRQVKGWVIAAAVAAVLLVIGIVLVVSLSGGHPDPTQQWINCLQRQIGDPSVVCVHP